MKYFQHRVNDVSSLLSLDNNATGLECDIRLLQGEYVLNHDPLKRSDQACKLNDFLIHPKSSGLDIILNFKDTGNELDVLNLCNTSFNEALILDAPFPVYVQALKKGLSSKFMWRVSEYERPDINILKKFSAKWLWLDSFHSYWFNDKLLKQYKAEGFFICLVSNELQGRHIEYKLTDEYKYLIFSYVDAICTKKPGFYNILSSY